MGYKDATKQAEYNREWERKNKRAYPAKFLWEGARERAKRKGIPFSITVNDIQVPDICPVLGVPLSFSNTLDGESKDFSPSIDRLDNSKGYVPGNVRVISYRANILKRDGTIGEFERIISYMKEHHHVQDHRD